MEQFLSQLTLFDIICVGIVVFTMLYGAVKGFIKELAGVISLLLSVVVAKIISIPLAVKLYEFFDVRGKILYKLGEAIQEVYSNTEGLAVEELRLRLDLVLKKFSFIGAYVTDSLSEDFGVYEIFAAGKESFVDDLSYKLMLKIEPVVQYFLSTIIFIILCILISIVVKLIMNAFSDIIKEIPIVGGMNTLLGLGLGVIKGVCLVVVVTLVAFIWVSIFNNPQSGTANIILDSKVFEFLSVFKYLIT